MEDFLSLKISCTSTAVLSYCDAGIYHSAANCPRSTVPYWSTVLLRTRMYWGVVGV
jgi:hypothetical protein